MAAVTAAVVIFAPPEFFGTRNNIAPPPNSTVRVPSLTVKIVFAPRRAIVLSVNVNSLRESTPVRTAVPSRTSSFTVALRGAAAVGNKFTSLMTAVTFPSFNSAPKRAEAASTESKNQ